jgi:hypothetical protein
LRQRTGFKSIIDGLCYHKTHIVNVRLGVSIFGLLNENRGRIPFERKYMRENHKRSLSGRKK